MLKGKTILLIILAAIWICCPSVFAAEKLAQSGFQFLSVGTDAGATGMGEAYTTIEGGSNAMFYNPAGLARLDKRFDATFSANNWIADIKHYAATLAYKPENGAWGTFGLSAMWIDYGELQGTMVWNNSLGYLDTDKFSPSALALGIGYGKLLNDKFAVGGQVKIVAQSLGESVIPSEHTWASGTVKKNVASTYAYDFGTVYQTGFKGIAFGMSVRNFSGEFKFEEESFQLPLTFKIGVSMDVLDLLNEKPENQSVLVCIDAVHPRSKAEYLNLGVCYQFMNMLNLRAGYISGQDEYGAAFGFGVSVMGVAFDYAYTPFGVFENVQRVTARISM
ncbi:PorV/PorQ family protein [candidate division KSB1 bacterium]|nr:PorV/PorQ family protein [candidate division KSB1 bacterium]